MADFNMNSRKRVITDVVIPRRVAAQEIFRSPAPSVRAPGNMQRRTRRRRIFLFVIMSMIFLVAYSFFGARMNVRIMPRRLEVRMDKTITLTRDANLRDALLLRSATLQDSRESSFSGTITVSAIERKAKGLVIIYNKSSQAPQVLVTNTRLKDPEGRIFRLPYTITVPGYRVENKEIIPGSREVEVVADRAGEEFNIGLTDFTFSGFEGSPKFKTVFARSKTVMKGGFKGNERSVDEASKRRALATLKAEAQAAMYGMLASKIPSDTLLLKSTLEYIPGDMFVNFND